MGGSSSKAVRPAANAARQYPSRASPSTTSRSSSPVSTPKAPPSSAQDAAAGPTVHPAPRASTTRSAAIDLDSRDPHFASRLREVGPVQPFPTYSPSSTSSPTPSRNSRFPAPSNNPSLAIVAARRRIEAEVEADKTSFGRRGFEGRRYLDVAQLRRALVLRDEQGVAPAQIEKALGVRSGFIKGLGKVGTVEAA